MRRRAVVRQEDQRRVAYKNMVSVFAMLNSFGPPSPWSPYDYHCCSLWLLHCCVYHKTYAVLHFPGEATLASSSQRDVLLCCSCGSRMPRTSSPALRRTPTRPARASQSTSPTTEQLLCPLGAQRSRRQRRPGWHAQPAQGLPHPFCMRKQLGRGFRQHVCLESHTRRWHRCSRADGQLSAVSRLARQMLCSTPSESTVQARGCERARPCAGFF